MRNLKRALSLALASVMLLGMMVVGSNAAIADVDPEKHNVEALEVLKLVGAMVGDGTNIAPDRLVTRNEAAVVIAHLLNKADSYVGHPFTDVPAWADAAVAEIYAEGITAGVSATEFGGNNTITTLQAGLFVLKALGYFQYASDLAIDGWEKATTKTAAEISLFKGVTSKANAGLTRNDFAQIVFNALNAKTVHAGEAKLAVGADGNLVNVYPYIKDQTDLKDVLFKNADGSAKLVKGTDIDDAGRPTTTWTLGTGNSAKQVAIAIEPDYAFTLTADVDRLFTGNDNLLTYMVDEEIVEDALVAASGWDCYVNGAEVTSSYARYITKGNDVELYLNSDDEITDVVILDYALLKVGTAADAEFTNDELEELEEAEAVEAGAKKLINLGASYKVYDVNFDKAYAENDYILAAVKVDGGYDDTEVVLASKAATVVEGKIDAVKDGKFRINGTYYTSILAGEDTVAKGDEGAWALNEAGKMAAVVVAPETKSSDYAFIYRVVESFGEAGKVGADGIMSDWTDTVWTAYVVLVDGTKATYPVAVEDRAEYPEEEEGVEPQVAEPVEPEFYIVGTDIALTPVNGNNESTVYDCAGLIAYEINEDGEMEVATASETIASGAIDANGTKIGSAYANAATKFVFVDVDDDDDTDDGQDKGVYVEVVASYKEVNLDAGSELFTISKSGKVLYAFYRTANPDAAEEAEEIEETLAIMMDNKAVEEGEDEDTTYTYEIWVDGKVIDWVVDAEDYAIIENAQLSNYQAFVYFTDENDTLTIATNVTNAEVVEKVIEGEYFYTTFSVVMEGDEEATEVSAKYDFADVTLYTYTIDEDDDVTITAGAELEAEDAVAVFVSEVDEDDAACAWVIFKIVDEDAE